MLATRQAASPAAVGAHGAPVPRFASLNNAASASLHDFDTAAPTFCAALVILLAVLASVGEVPRQTVAGSPDSFPDLIAWRRSEEHTSELQSLRHLVCRLLLEKKKKKRSVV